jgi:hypothetical protein
MRILTLLLFTTSIFFSGCRTFDGVVGNINEDYTTPYNYPGGRIDPYNNPEVENKEPNKTVNVCTGVPDPNGFKCNK